LRPLSQTPERADAASCGLKAPGAIISQPEFSSRSYITSTTKTSAIHNMMLSFKTGLKKPSGKQRAAIGFCRNGSSPDHLMFSKIHVDLQNV
jgi:hypothetical protein